VVDLSIPRLRDITANSHILSKYSLAAFSTTVTGGAYGSQMLEEALPSQAKKKKRGWRRGWMKMMLTV
jgi:hypothetical protein